MYDDGTTFWSADVVDLGLVATRDDDGWIAKLLVNGRCVASERCPSLDAAKRAAVRLGLERVRAMMDGLGRVA